LDSLINLFNSAYATVYVGTFRLLLEKFGDFLLENWVTLAMTREREGYNLEEISLLERLEKEFALKTKMSKSKLASTETKNELIFTSKLGTSVDTLLLR